MPGMNYDGEQYKTNPFKIYLWMVIPIMMLVTYYNESDSWGEVTRVGVVLVVVSVVVVLAVALLVVVVAVVVVLEVVVFVMEGEWTRRLWCRQERNISQRYQGKEPFARKHKSGHRQAGRQGTSIN